MVFVSSAVIPPENDVQRQFSVRRNPVAHLFTKDRSFVNKDLASVNKDRSFGDQDRSFVDKDLSAVIPDRSFVNKDRSAMIPDRSFLIPDLTFVDKDLPAAVVNLPGVGSITVLLKDIDQIDPFPLRYMLQKVAQRSQLDGGIVIALGVHRFFAAD